MSFRGSTGSWRAGILWRKCTGILFSGLNLHPRHLQYDARNRLSNFWIPPMTVKYDDLPLDANELLLRAGFIRQAYSGIYHLLPLGLRVQGKIEALIEKHMHAIGASKLSLSSFSAQDLWDQSGRLSTGSELFKFTDRKDAKWLLSPTHEEEITSLVAYYTRSYRDLPIRLYQIGRKYRDERRPRGGLLRGREFVMKDLYTFDVTVEAAMATYDQVRTTYKKIFDELKVPYIEAQADSGNMGGNWSHEYHFPSDKGEDSILSCTDCGYARNEELVDEVEYKHEKVQVQNLTKAADEHDIENKLLEFVTVSEDGSSLVKAFAMPSEMKTSTEGAKRREFNTYAIKAAFANVIDLDTGIEDPVRFFADTAVKTNKSTLIRTSTIYYLFDNSVDEATANLRIALDQSQGKSAESEVFKITQAPTSSTKLQLLKRQTGDACPECDKGKLQVHTAIEVGHTFHLGARYSAKLGANIVRASDPIPVPMQMGCHGIGVSRLIAATASCLADTKGLNWPRAIAPFQAIIVPKLTNGEDDFIMLQDAESIYDKLLSPSGTRVTDAIIDDRIDTRLPAKLHDADIIGYPIIVVLGNSWKKGKVEVQCRRLQLKKEVNIDDMKELVDEILRQL